MTALARRYTYDVAIPREATLDDVDGVIELLAGLGFVDPQLVERRLRVEQDVEPSDGAIEALPDSRGIRANYCDGFRVGYALADAEREVEDELRARGWRPPARPWRPVEGDE